MNRENGRRAITSLVERYSQYRDIYTRSNSTYTETELRTDFLNPLLDALGWDVTNANRAPQHLREVVQERTIEMDEEAHPQGRPDYTLTVAGEPKLFVEAKKPSVSIETADRPALQLRRYGWTARMPISILTNFDKMIVFDCRQQPKEGDSTRVAQIEVFDFKDYVSRFDELCDLFSRETLFSGDFDRNFGVDQVIVGHAPFDQYFLGQIESWRERLAAGIMLENPWIDQAQLNFIVQRLINRVVFLRICEDRNLEAYKALEGVTSYDDLKSLFKNADCKYNSGLFDFVEDSLSPNIELRTEILLDIFKELYYPASPYVFTVVDPSILSEIYELFIAKEVQLNADSSITVKEKPEVAVSQGVVPTPKYIVDEIIDKTVVSLCEDKTPEEISSLRIADIACGSGVFLLSAYEHLLNYHLEWYLKDGAARHREQIYEGVDNEWHLTLFEKKRILLNNIYGVDIDIQAVEVSRFGLLLTALEGTTNAEIEGLLNTLHVKALPNVDQNIKCGNSLVDDSFFKYDPSAITSRELNERIKPFDWSAEYSNIMRKGGFDAIMGNPPYTRIQNMVKYLPEEVRYYQSSSSPYTTSQVDNFDKYSLFIERALCLLSSSGLLGYIVPNRFFATRAGRSLRKLIATSQHLHNIIDFGVQQVFGEKVTTYTCILVLTKQPSHQFDVEIVADLNAWRYGKDRFVDTYEEDFVNDEPWELLTPESRRLFERLRAENPKILEDVAEIFVGVQTSKDRIFVITPSSETSDLIGFSDIDGAEWIIEKAILRPSVYDSEIKPFGRTPRNSYIIFPYRITNERALLVSHEEMEEYFPNCWRYLCAHKEALLDRDIQNATDTTWYGYGRTQSLTKFDGRPRLVWPILSLEPRYSYDDQNIVFTGGGNGPYYALRPLENCDLSIYYLQAVLSHPIIEAMVRSRATKFRGGYASHGKQFVKHLPIRIVDHGNKDDESVYKEVIKLTKDVIDLQALPTDERAPNEREIIARQRTALRNQINRLVAQLYRMSSKDVSTYQELIDYWQGAST